MNVFYKVKSRLSLLDVIPRYTEKEMISCGTDTYEMEDKECPFCGHRDCFKVKEEGNHESFYKCFSCGNTGDIFSFVKEVLQLEEMKDALDRIVSDYGIVLDKEAPLTPTEKILDMAAHYYAGVLHDTDCKIRVGNDMHPLQYQLEHRKHSEEWLARLNIGFSDGLLHLYLDSQGVPAQDMVESGLVNKDKYGRLYDFFSPGLFLYPHYVYGKVSSFSQKDPSGKLDYQFPAKFRLNNCLFWGQETIREASKVAMVEGQNDRISLLEAGFDGAVLCTCGSLSGKQLEWMRENLEGKQIVTFFDSDDAGDTYRDKFKKVFPSCTQIKLDITIAKDIDEWLKKASRSLLEAFSHAMSTSVLPKEQIPELEPSRASETGSVSIPSFDRELNMVEKDGSYFLIKVDKEGGQNLVRLTDFTIKLKNIFLLDGKRVREAEVLRWDGIRSHSMLIDSETKVSLKQFKAKVADACDANFFGTESDLMNMWRYVYKHGAEKTVYVPDHVGMIENDGGWLFRNMYLRPNGEVIYPDKSGVMWVGGNSRGIRPQSISEDLDYDVYANGSRSIPKLPIGMTSEEIESVEQTLMRMYAQNLGDVGKAALILGWAKMNAFSGRLFEEYGFTPFMFLWGGNGIGKTSLLHWVLSVYAMKENGYDTLSNLRSGVGFERKLGYYSSLPVCLDELRTGKEMMEFTGRFRAWYNRSGRSMASMGSKKIVQQRIRSNFIFGGQDIFTDDALRERCVVVRIQKEGRELKDSYRVLSKLEMTGKLSAVGLKWIQEAISCDFEQVLGGIEAWCNQLLEQGCKPRTARVWALISYFASALVQKHIPDYDFLSYVIQSCKRDVTSQVDNGFVNRFFELVEGILFMVNTPYTSDHFKVQNGKLCIWFTDVYRIAASFRRDATEETFSKEAIKSSIGEEPYFGGETVTRTGVSNTSRRVLVVDLASEGVPDALRNIGEFVSHKW